MKLQHNKTDAGDAVLLAEIARTGFFRAVSVNSEAARVRRMAVKARRHLVGQRRATENAIRGFLAALGIRFAKGSGKLAGRARAALKHEAERLDQAARTRAEAAPACRLLMSAPGVGPVTALAFAATIDTPERFAKSRTVGAYPGLTSRRFQSGEMGYSGRISKHGDAMPRSLLYEAANSMLTVVRRAHPLKDWARRIRNRGSHGSARVALARKLAVIMHRMLITGEAFRWPAKEEAATA